MPSLKYISSILKAQISAESTTMYGWDNPYKDTDVSNLNKKLAVIFYFLQLTPSKN